MSESASTPHSRRATLLSALALIVVAFIFFSHFMFGRLPVSTDMSLMYAPFYSLQWDGGPPLWNPHLAGGMAMTGNLQFSAWYPPRWPFYFISDWRSYFSLFMFLHYVIALGGACGAMRAMGLSRVAAFAGAIAFACGGYMVARIINTTIFLASCWFPWLVWGAVAGRNLRAGWPALLGMAMIILAGSPHVMIYGTIGFAVAWLALINHKGTEPQSSENETSPRTRTLLSYMHGWLWLVGGIILGLPSLIPGLIQVEGSIRTLTDMQNNLADSLRWGEIPLALLGGMGGAMVPEINDKSLYIGGVGLCFVALGCFYAPHWRDRRWWCGCALVIAGLVLALGNNVGWQFIMPWIPGLKLLEGPARALVLTSLGLALLIALAVEHVGEIRRAHRLIAPLLCVPILVVATLWLVWPRSSPDQRASLAEVLLAWAQAPQAISGRAFAAVDGWITLVLATALLVAWRRAHRGLGAVMTLLLAAELLHFSPRVRARTEARDFFDPPPNVQFLMERAKTEDFRIAAMDPLQAHDVEWDNLHKLKFLMPNTATLYDLDDIRGFDPLIPLDYYNAFRAAAGSAPYNDPIRNLDLGRPDEGLFEKLNVRYFIGHPGDRRVTHLPTFLAPNNPQAEVTAWKDLNVTDAIEAWHFVSLVDGQSIPPHGTLMAKLHIESAEGNIEFPIRYGIETAHVMDQREPDASSNLHVNMRWFSYTLDAENDFRRTQQNYRATIRFAQPLHVHTARWELLRPDAILYIPAQACRLDSTLFDENWTRVYDDPVAPVYEFNPIKLNP